MKLIKQYFPIFFKKKKTLVQCGTPHLKLILKGIMQTPKPGYFIALGCLREHEGKIILLKTMHTLCIRQGTIMLVMTRKFLCYLALILLESAI